MLAIKVAKNQKKKIHKLYWLVGRHSTLYLANKWFLYVAIIKPIWTYYVQLWECASKSNSEDIQHCQNTALLTIVGVY